MWFKHVTHKAWGAIQPATSCWYERLTSAAPNSAKEKLSTCPDDWFLISAAVWLCWLAGCRPGCCVMSSVWTGDSVGFINPRAAEHWADLKTGESLEFWPGWDAAPEDRLTCSVGTRQYCLNERISEVNRCRLLGVKAVGASWQCEENHVVTWTNESSCGHNQHLHLDDCGWITVYYGSYNKWVFLPFSL